MVGKLNTSKILMLERSYSPKTLDCHSLFWKVSFKNVERGVGERCLEWSKGTVVLIHVAVCLSPVRGREPRL